MQPPFIKMILCERGESARGAQAEEKGKEKRLLSHRGNSTYVVSFICILMCFSVYGSY